MVRFLVNWTTVITEVIHLGINERHLHLIKKEFGDKKLKSQGDKKLFLIEISPSLVHVQNQCLSIATLVAKARIKEFLSEVGIELKDIIDLSEDYYCFISAEDNMKIRKRLLKRKGINVLLTNEFGKRRIEN